MFARETRSCFGAMVGAAKTQKGRSWPWHKASGRRPTLVATTHVMAEAATLTVHTGAGVARRAAHHERQAAERAQVEARAAPPELNIVSVPAAEVLEQVAEEGPNYRIVKRSESKKTRRKRLRAAAKAREEEAAAGEAAAEASVGGARAVEQQSGETRSEAAAGGVEAMRLNVE